MKDMKQACCEHKISVVMNTYNAALYLEDVLDSVSEFDEVVVCDMESTDGTPDIARRKGCRVITFKKGNISICEPARDFAVHSARHEWVLVVDADEIVTPQLRSYLYGRIRRGDCPQGLFIPRRNKFMGRYGHSSPDYQLRFLMRDRTRWRPVIHCLPDIDGTVEKISACLTGVHLLHLDDAGISSRVSKMNVYTDYEVPRRAGRHHGMLSLLLRPLWFFVRSLLLHGGVLDGRRGLIKAYMAAVYQIVLLAKIQENKWKDGKDKYNGTR